jgi:hypothetical protein
MWAECSIYNVTVGGEHSYHYPITYLLSTVGGEHSYHYPITYRLSTVGGEHSYHYPITYRVSTVGGEHSYHYPITYRVSTVAQFAVIPHINSLTPELNPSTQRCLARIFTGDFIF